MTFPVHAAIRKTSTYTLAAASANGAAGQQVAENTLA